MKMDQSTSTADNWLISPNADAMDIMPTKSQSFPRFQNHFPGAAKRREVRMQEDNSQGATRD
jgi:hypothetical protein